MANVESAYACFCADNDLVRVGATPEQHLSNIRKMAEDLIVLHAIYEAENVKREHRSWFRRLFSSPGE